MSNQVLVAISRDPLSEKLIFSLKDQALQHGVSLHSIGGQVSNGAYFSERFESNAHIETAQREQLRALTARFNADLCFLKPDLVPQDIRVLAMDMDSTLINIECIDEIAISSMHSILISVESISIASTRISCGTRSGFKKQRSALNLAVKARSCSR
jgi:hypothetical protein